MGMILTINTNGTLLDEAWADFFATYPPRRINITLYGADAASYDRLCHYPQGFDQTLRAVRLLRARNVDVKISCSVTKKNPQDFSRNFCPRKRARSPCSRRSLYDARRPGTLPPFRCAGTPAPRRRCRAGLSGAEAAAGRRYFPAICPGIRPSCQRPGFPAGDGHISCLAGNCSFFINWQGRLFPCVMLSEISAPVFDLGFIAAWEKVSAAAQNLSLSHKCCQCRLQPICRTCVAAAFLETSSYQGMPGYLCRYSEHYYHLLLAEEASFSSIAL